MESLNPVVKKDLTAWIFSAEGKPKGSINSSVNLIIVSDKILRQNLLSTASPISHTMCKVQDIGRSYSVSKRTIGFLNQDSDTRPSQLLDTSSWLEDERIEFKNLFQLLNNPQWSLISYSDIRQKLERMETGTLDWHWKRAENNPMMKRISKD